MRTWILVVMFWLAILLLATPARAIDHQKLLDLQIGNKHLIGRVLTHDDQHCWFLGRDGRLEQFSLGSVTAFAEVADRFQPQTHQELKQQLQSEFGKRFEIQTTQHYVVAGRPDVVRNYAHLFEQIYRDFIRSFRSRGLQVAESEFPLIAIVFPTQAAFLDYCRAEKTPAQPGLVGFYLPGSNRVALYERPDDSNIDGTVIHEATHQVAFNTGVHSRLAKHPRWMVEGLATVFEADGVRHRHDSPRPIDRVNRERYLWFQEYSQQRRLPKSAGQLVEQDEPFDRAPLDAYSEAWAFSFFLLETRPVEYSNYLQTVARRDPLASYSATERLRDFSVSFAASPDELDAAFLRFIRKLAP